MDKTTQEATNNIKRRKLDDIPEGKTIQCTNESTGKVYRWEFGELHNYPNGKIANSWNPNWRGDLSYADCTDLQIGSPMTFGSILEGYGVRCTDANDGKVYRWTNNELHHYPNDGKVATSWNPNWRGDIVDLDTCGSYTVGTPMSFNTAAPTATPTVMMPLTTIAEAKMIGGSIAHVDFSDAASPSNTPFVLKNGAQILPTAPGGFSALRIDRDGPYALIPGVNISPSVMPDCTLTIGLYLESIANTQGWVFGSEQSGYDRTILMHDRRFGGGVASAVGKTWQPWFKPQSPALKEWMYVTAVFRQWGESVVYVNGVRSDRSVIATNNDGRGDLAIGRPVPHGNHWVNSWIKEVHVFESALDDEAVERLTSTFFRSIS